VNVKLAGWTNHVTGSTAGRVLVGDGPTSEPLEQALGAEPAQSASNRCTDGGNSMPGRKSGAGNADG